MNINRKKIRALSKVALVSVALTLIIFMMISATRVTDVEDQIWNIELFEKFLFIALIISVNMVLLISVIIFIYEKSSKEKSVNFRRLLFIIIFPYISSFLILFVFLGMKNRQLKFWGWDQLKEHEPKNNK